MTRRISATGRFMISLAVVGIAVPQAVYAADAFQHSDSTMHPPPLRPPTSLVQDVALDLHGSLRGRVVDSEAKPQMGTIVLVRKDGEVVARAVTGDDGQFAAANMRAGVYEVAAKDAAGVFRVWTSPTAPPSARANAILVVDKATVRGQNGSWRRALIISGIAITSGVIGGVIGYNIRDFDPAS